MAISNLVFDGLGLVPMPMITVHEQVHQWTGQDEDEWEKCHDMLAVVNPQVISQRCRQTQKRQAQW
jgi:hypothetical protein